MSETSRLTSRPVTWFAVLAGVLVAAGIVPWAAGGGLAAKLFAVPLVLAGLFVGLLAYRLVRDPGRLGRAVRAARSPACGSCQCGESCLRGSQ